MGEKPGANSTSRQVGETCRLAAWRYVARMGWLRRHGFAFFFGNGSQFKPHALVARVGLVMIVLVRPDLLGDAFGKCSAGLVSRRAVEVGASGAQGLDVVRHRKAPPVQSDESGLACKFRCPNRECSVEIRPQSDLETVQITQWRMPGRLQNADNLHRTSSRGIGDFGHGR